MRRTFGLAAQYIILAHALQPSKEVYQKSLHVIQPLLPLPHLRAGFLTAADPATAHSCNERCGPTASWTSLSLSTYRYTVLEGPGGAQTRCRLPCSDAKKTSSSFFGSPMLAASWALLACRWEQSWFVIDQESFRSSQGDSAPQQAEEAAEVLSNPQVQHRCAELCQGPIRTIMGLIKRCMHEARY